MADRISFSCPSCSAVLRAPIRFGGRSCTCPGCGNTLGVPLRAPSEEPPLLVFDDGSQHPHGSRRGN
jgi:hypothetical protein